MQRQTSYLLVILKHEKPIKDLPDVIADRLSKLEGVDGSGVIVSKFDAEAGKDFIVRAEAVENARYGGDVVEPVDPFEAELDACAVKPLERAELMTAIDSIAAGHKAIYESTWPGTAEDLDKTARLLTKGMGENITT